LNNLDREAVTRDSPSRVARFAVDFVECRAKNFHRKEAKFTKESKLQSRVLRDLGSRSGCFPRKDAKLAKL